MSNHESKDDMMDKDTIVQTKQHARRVAEHAMEMLIALLKHDERKKQDETPSSIHQFAYTALRAVRLLLCTEDQEVLVQRTGPTSATGIVPHLFRLLASKQFDTSKHSKMTALCDNLKLECAWIITNLSYDTKLDMVPFMVNKCDAIPILLAQFKTTNSSEVHAQVIWALGNFVGDSVSVRQQCIRQHHLLRRLHDLLHKAITGPSSSSSSSSSIARDKKIQHNVNSNSNGSGSSKNDNSTPLEQRIRLIDTITWAMGNVCCDGFTHLTTQALDDVIVMSQQVLDRCMYSHVSSEALTDVCWGLCNLTKNKEEEDENKHEAKEAKTQETHNDTQQHDPQQQSYSQWLDHLVHHQIPYRLVRLLQSPHVANANLLHMVIRVLGHFVESNDDAHTQAVLDARFLPVLAHLLEQPRFSIKAAACKDPESKSFMVLQKACWALSNVAAGNTSQRLALLHANLLPAIVRMALAPWHMNIRSDALWTLATLVQNVAKEPDGNLTMHVTVGTPQGTPQRFEGSQGGGGSVADSSGALAALIGAFGDLKSFEDGGGHHDLLKEMVVAVQNTVDAASRESSGPSEFLPVVTRLMQSSTPGFDAMTTWRSQHMPTAMETKEEQDHQQDHQQEAAARAVEDTTEEFLQLQLQQQAEEEAEDEDDEEDDEDENSDQESGYESNEEDERKSTAEQEEDPMEIEMADDEVAFYSQFSNLVQGALSSLPSSSVSA